MEQETKICKRCNRFAVKLNAGFVTQIWYWYCKNCKAEINYLGYPITQPSNSTQDEQRHKEEERRRNISSFFIDIAEDEEII